jgi:hypothetical protein
MPVPKGTRIGGRSKGTKNKATIEREQGHAEIVEQAKAEGVSPLEYMLKVMRDEGADKKRRDVMAVAAAGYVHPKLASVEHSGSMSIAHEDAIEAIEAEANGNPLERAN